MCELSKRRGFSSYGRCQTKVSLALAGGRQEQWNAHTVSLSDMTGEYCTKMWSGWLRLRTDKDVVGDKSERRWAQSISITVQVTRTHGYGVEWIECSVDPLDAQGCTQSTEAQPDGHEGTALRDEDRISCIYTEYKGTSTHLFRQDT